ncbi:hypothetical protein HELRODRAFT_179614 [Helobdella robusta]|uniref:Chibby homolog 1 n=1 Tax=Helobdella robusta TaxID=6412 RepID=T1FEX9_HELRO|nr:hypothetical protein HELRODRAFT_179614 [Helobdella robusta]ESN95273.1 hypothetical protein HELRODRAFT_179614 [Helobdella robusta]
MPFSFLSNKFKPKKGPTRKAASLSNLNLSAEERKIDFRPDDGNIKVRLGENILHFERGDWVADGDEPTNNKEMKRLKKQLQQTIEEKNFLTIKVELLLDMLAKRTAENQMQNILIEELKKQRTTR